MESRAGWLGGPGLAMACLLVAMALVGATGAGTIPKTIRGRDGASMILSLAGEFTMGSNCCEENEKPPHRVSISAFCIDKYEVTFDQYDRFCEATGRAKPEDAGWGRGSRPVINVTWDDANAYALDYGKRLPTEAEWEYACRAGGRGKWCFGNGEGRLDEYAWYGTNANSVGHPVGTRPVGQKKPNAWGLYDMHGNVWEWCADWYDMNNYADSPDQNPTGAVSGQYRVLRGGSWVNVARVCRSAYRECGPPMYRLKADGFNHAVGFRCAMSVKAQ